MSRRSAATVILCVAMGQFFAPVCPAQETDFRGWEDHPGLHFYLVQDAPLWTADVLSVTRTPVRDHVRGEHALKLMFHVTQHAAGLVVYRPPGFAAGDRTPYGALSFWVKGDGSEGVGVVGIGDGAADDPRAQFRLGSRDWQPVRLRWQDFDREITAPEIRSLFFSVTSGTRRPAGYIIDRIELARSIDPPDEDEAVREAGRKAAGLVEASRPDDLSAFVSGRDKLSDFRARVEAKKPVRVLVVGDAVAQGAGLWNVPAGVRSTRLFWGVFDGELRKRGAASTVGLQAVSGAADAASRVQVALRRYKPDLVIVQLSSSAPGVSGAGAIARTRREVQAVFSICRRGKVPVVALGVPALPDAFRRVDESSVLLEEAVRAGVPTADFGRLAAARGKGFEGEYYAETDQLNVQGHLLAGKLLTTFLTEP